MGRNWTEQQKMAIEARDGSILVSAAAGSGKTAVLVERVIRRITDDKKLCPANNLLIVTFTKAAANEMRERINEALDKKIKENPENSFLREQQMLLPDAQICTIDSFCNSLVKENFHFLDISPDFGIIDDSQHSILINQAVDCILEKKYAEKTPAFMLLTETFFANRDDRELANSIVQLYRYSTAYPFPEKWLDSIIDSYKNTERVIDNPWGKKTAEYLLTAADYCLELNTQMQMLYEDDDVFAASYGEACNSDREKLLSFRKALEEGLWDEGMIILQQSFAKRKNLPKGVNKEPLAILLEEKRGIIKKTVKDRILKYMCVSQDENREDFEYLEPIVSELAECTKEFSSELFRLKKEANTYDFSDIARMALSLLVKETDDGYERTDFAAEMSERYAEILIDEYQDTNKQQDMFFEALSKNGSNLFRVGDVKQSIYSFRQAMPEIFIALRSALEPYKDNNYPAKIILDKNFRSRKEVTSYINFLFSQMMSEQFCNIDYDEQEQLVPGADYYNETPIPKAHLHLIDLESDDLYDSDSLVCQAKHIAGLIKDMIAEKRPVQDKNGLRPVRYKDICILLRSTKNAGKVFADELRQWEIPCYTEVTGNFFSSTEISLMLSMLRVIDNPLQDIPLLSVLHSPIFSFTPDDVAGLRIKNRSGSLYSCLIAAEDENKKVADFLTFFRKIRYIASTSTASDLIRRIYEDTSFPAICRAMDGDGDFRRSNLMLLIDYADAYEKSGYIGVSGFIRFIDKLAEGNKELDASNPISENADVVRIMTIHKSKGLEFPICILANANKQFNAEDEKKGMVITSDPGIGLVRRDVDTLAEYETLPHSTAKLMRNMASKAEEMRILYVALTRAKEDLFIIGSVKGAEKTAVKLSADMNINKTRLDPFSMLIRNSYSDWIIKAAFRHPDCRELRALADIDESVVIDSDFRLDLKIIKNLRDFRNAKVTGRTEGRIDEAFLQVIKAGVEYKYKYSDLTGIPTKVAASGLGKAALDTEYFATSKPAFMSESSGLTAAEKGTAMHKSVQYIDYAKARVDLDAEISRLVDNNLMTVQEAESLDKVRLTSFLNGELADRIINSNTVFREKKFTVDIPAGMIYPQLEDDFGETVMIQGIVDCAFIENGKMIIVDYKTDRVRDEERLADMYSHQLRIYKYAMEKITGYEVSKTYLYSFYLSKETEI